MKRPRETFTTRPLGGYGLWEATVRTPDGREFTGGGWGEKAAYLNALAVARETEKTQQQEQAR